MFTIYNATSSDGYIARLDGSEDFIPDNVWPYFLHLCNEHGSLVMGRKSYDSVQKYDKKLIESLEELPIRLVVVTKNRKDFIPRKRYVVAHSPEDAYAFAPGALVSSGPGLNNELIKKRMIGTIIIRELPITIDEGIKPFDIDTASLILNKKYFGPENTIIKKYSVKYF